MKNIFLALLCIASINSAFAQENSYPVNANNGNGLKFWNGSDAYKIHMGDGSEYHFGPVTDYSIKTNMDNYTNERGFTWGREGTPPIAAISILGHMQIAGNFNLMANNMLELGIGLTKGTSAGVIAYQKWSDGLDIAGAGTSSTNRKINFYAEGGASINGTLDVPKINLTPNNSIGLSIAGNNGTYTGPDLHITRSSTIAEVGKGANIQMGDLGSNNHILLQASSSGFQFFNYTGTSGWAERFHISPNGYTGIGTTSPDQMLTVNGTIHSKEVKVDLTVPGPDYVFEDSYNLPSLEKVQSYIDQNKHLPEVPSAREMEKNGINVSEMNMILLKKVEELTLYVIELKKENDKIKNEMIRMKALIEK